MKSTLTNVTLLTFTTLVARMSDRKDHNPPIGFEPLSLGMGRVTIKDFRRFLGMGRVTIKDLLGALAFDLVALLRPPIMWSRF